MCGIIGYTTRKNNSVEVALDGLKNLEYRGYDSAGIAFFDGEKIDIVKSKGKISNLYHSVSIGRHHKNHHIP